MKEKNTVYYMVWKTTVAKREEDEVYYYDHLFKNGKWVPDNNHVILDHLFGFDPSEPEDSPYRFGSTSVLMEMHEITEEEAVSAMNQQILDILKEKWKCQFMKKKEEWGREPCGKPANYAETRFKLNGITLSIRPEDIGLDTGSYEQGFIKSIQSDIEKDLKEYGAADIRNYGFPDQP